MYNFLVAVRPQRERLVRRTAGVDHGARHLDGEEGLAQMLKGGVIMDVVTPEQATHRPEPARAR